MSTHPDTLDGMASATFDSFYARALALNASHDADAGALTQRAIAVVDEATSAGLSPLELSAIRFMCSSIVINAGALTSDVRALDLGREIAESALVGLDPSAPLYQQCRYNIANALSEKCGLDLPSGTDRSEWEPALIATRTACRDALREVRRTYFDVGMAESTDSRTRSAALCNLANELDHSGRWAEAYDFYLRSLEADPRNGNAAGNLAQLLASRIESGIGQTGHIAAVYDKYVALAKSLREGTLEFAAQRVADRWDALEATESLGHVSHGLDDQATDIEYRRWVAKHRLALSPAVEGLGTDELRWDSATVEILFGSTIDEVSPPLLAAMNVLKADFVVSRTLGFEGTVEVLEGLEQRGDDTGLYTETGDYSLYGTQYSKLLLAQRSALDVLDKTAVVANEHWAVGDTPTQVAFRRFWTTKSGTLRPALVKQSGRGLAAFAMAELAHDLADEGLYAESQALRNAGTHRIVHAALFDATGTTREALSTIAFDELVASTTLALQVTRSAYLYLVDLVASWNHPDDFPGTYARVASLPYVFDTLSGALSSPGDDH